MRRNSRFDALLRLLVLACALSLLMPSFAADELTGQASVIDGDTLEIHGTRVRPWSMNAPETDRLCRGEDILQYRCGAKAANNLDAFIADRSVRCSPRDVDQYGRTVAICAVGGTDLGAWLVSQGLALDWPTYSNGRYTALQREAEHANRGVWAGSFVQPCGVGNACVLAGGLPTVLTILAQRVEN